MNVIRYLTVLAGLSLLILLAPVDAAARDTLARGSFPLSSTTDSGVIRIGEPRIRGWDSFRQLSGSFPFEQVPAGAAAGRGEQGQAMFEAATVVDFEKRLVALRKLRITGAGLDEDLRESLQEALDAASPTLALDWLLQNLPEDFEIPHQAALAPQLNFQPPRIVVSNRPMRLMLIDGPPAPVTVEPTALEFVVNTDWDVFHDTSSGRWFILDDGHWITNNMLSSGDWLNTTDLPRDFLTLQVSSDWPQVGQAMPPRRKDEPPIPVTISYEPTELILIDGEARLEAIGSRGLQYVSNTESDLFVLDGRYYYLAAGRWFRTKDLKRQWHAVRDLPSAFAEIPENHPRARVLASVPGTPAARIARIEAAIPRIATVQIGAANRMEIPYLGEPSFVEIRGTPLRRAENTPFQVIMHNNFYYLCHEGAWYSSSGPQGPWEAAREIPEAIYTIPSTDPAYNVTFVRLDAFDDSSGRAAYVSTSGYYSRYYTGSTVVYGTGWYYPGYYDRYAYWRYPYTYGYRGYWGSYWYPWGYPYYHYHYSETFEVNREEADWEWNLDGSKRRVYNYGPKNYVGGTYRMPDSNIYKGDGK